MICHRDLNPVQGSPRSYLPWVSHEHALQSPFARRRKTRARRSRGGTETWWGGASGRGINGASFAREYRVSQISEKAPYLTSLTPPLSLVPTDTNHISSSSSPRSSSACVSARRFSASASKMAGASSCRKNAVAECLYATSKLIFPPAPLTRVT